MRPYLSVFYFSSSFLVLLSIHGQLISIVQTPFLSWLTSRVSIRFVLTSLCSAWMGISQNASPVVFWWAGFGITGEYHGGTSSIDPCSRRSSKNRIFEAALCLYMYLVCAREEHPTSTCATLSASFRNEGGFRFRKPLGVFFVALRNFFEALDHTLVYGAGAFPPKVTDFIRPWRAPVAILGQDFDHFRYFESPFVACRWWYLLVEGDLHFLQSGRVLVPSPSLLLQLYPKTRLPLQCFQTFSNHLEHVF